jgi:cytochrome c peroxidase
MKKPWITISCIVLFISSASLFLNSCKKQGPSFTGTIVPFVVPAGFPQPAHNFTDDPLTTEGIALGQKLFYDGSLSKDGKIPCSSCHEQDAAFTTYEHDLSHGFNHFHTTRNATALSNLAWYYLFNKDGSASNLNIISEAHITNPKEMSGNMNDVISKLNGDQKYKAMFTAAYGNSNISSDKIFTALKQFLLSMVSSNSKYDKVLKGEASFTPLEKSGYEIFKAKCGSCHAEPMFTDYTYRNIGLPVNPSITDYGRYSVTKNRSDSLKFLVPSLRNVALSSYYMHDGRFPSLPKAIEHYRTGIVKNTTLDPSLTNGIKLTTTEVANLVLFLKTLTDSAYITDKRFAKPLF